jgi:hypothetical protein
MFEPGKPPVMWKMGQHTQKSILGILGDLFSENAKVPYRVKLESLSLMPTAPSPDASSFKIWLPKGR